MVEFLLIKTSFFGFKELILASDASLHGTLFRNVSVILIMAGLLLVLAISHEV